MSSLTAAARAERNSFADEPRRFVDRNVLWGLSAGGSSMVVHLALLLVLGLLITPQIERPRPPLIEARVEQERPQEAITQKLPTPAAAAKTLTFGPSDSSRRAAGAVNGAVRRAVPAPQLAQERLAKQSTVRLDVGVQQIFRQSSRTLADHVPQGQTGEAHAPVAGYDQALDRMTQELLNKLSAGKVLVVWIFDQSESMQDDRDEILGRIDRVYEELKLSPTAAGDALVSSVVAYGAAVQLLTAKPTADPAQIKAAMQQVAVDPSGKEVMCTAVSTAIAQHQKFAQQSGRQLLCILVTDESGEADDNFAHLESTIALARAARSVVYVLGREAVFGYPYAHLRWVDPDTKLDFWLRIDRGPESPYPEQLQVDGIHRRFDAHPSGFGPYEQTRLARQTGGIFFLLPTPEANLWRRDDRNYDADAMRPYLPDLAARADYARERDQQPLRATLWKVISDLNPYDKRLESLVQVRFWDWPIEPAAFAREADTNVKKAQTLIGCFAAAERALEAVRPQRARERSLRWRANYDVTYAQTIAYQARLYEYIAYVTGFVRNPKPIRNELGASRPTNSWDGRYVKRTVVAEPAVVKLRERSTELYRQVVADHPGTPWAARAEYELTRGFGCEFVEDYEDPRRANVVVPKP